MECEKRSTESEPINQTVEDDEDDDIPQLSGDTLAALQEFYAEQETIRQLLERNLTTSTEENEEGAQSVTTGESTNGNEDAKEELFKIELNKTFPEDWQLSQFWYDEETSNFLADEVLKQAGEGKVACISCPSIFRACSNAPNVTLFEYDKRFKAFGKAYHFYDYSKPEDIPEHCFESFSVVVADPPFLSEECLEKVSITVKKIVQENGKILLCTGTIFEFLGSTARIKDEELMMRNHIIFHVLLCLDRCGNGTNSFPDLRTKALIFCT